MGIQLLIPERALVVLVGASGSGKTTFARQHFKPTEIVSSDACRGLLADDENDQSASADAFALLHIIVAKRLARGRRTVVDATNVQAEARRPLLKLAEEFRAPAVAIVLNLPQEICLEHNARRPDRTVDARVVAEQSEDLQRALPRLAKEGFARVYVLSSPEEANGAAIAEEQKWKREDRN
jgi:protein phosphatase